ncbi:MAG: phosphoribosyltransferase-like protein [Sulfobacillus sp.]
MEGTLFDSSSTLSSNPLRTQLERLSTQPYHDDGRHPLDPDKVSQYLSEIVDPIYRQIVGYVLEHTKYLTMSEVTSGLRELVANAISEIEEDLCSRGSDAGFYLLLRNKKNPGSEHWFAAKTMDIYSDSPQFRGWISPTDDVPDLSAANLLLIDDAIYSGFQLIEMLDDLIEHLPRPTPAIGRRTAPTTAPAHIWIVTYLATTSGPRYIEASDSGRSLDLRFRHRLVEEPLFLQDPPPGHPPPRLDPRLHTYFNEWFLERAVCWTDIAGRVPVYMDHKVANRHGSFPEIYVRGWLDPEGKKKFGSLMQCLPSRPTGPTIYDDC